MSNTSNEIFYSEVNQSLQNELNARGVSGFRRTTADLNFMLGKIANIQVTAYRDQEYKTPMYSVGGREVASGAYVAGGESGFLRKKTWTVIDQAGTTASGSDNSFRTPPFITSADIQLNDHSYGLLNSATIMMSIPNPDRDLAFVESVFARPGRALEMKIAHPESAVVSKNLYLVPQSYTVSTTNLTISETNTNKPVDKSLSKLHEVIFRGLLISFDYAYQQDGTVSLTLYLRGRADVYTDVSMYVVKKTTDQTADNKVISFYQMIYDEYERFRKTIVADRTVNKDIAYIGKGTTITGPNRKDNTWAYLTDWNNQTQRYVSLGFLVEWINLNLLTKIKETAPYANVECSELVCFSNYFPNIVSSDPVNIWLPSNNQTKTDVYGTETSNSKQRRWYKILKTHGGSNQTELGSFHDKHPITNKLVGYPSRIMINLNVIKNIYDKLKTTKDTFNVSAFYKELTNIIFNATGGVINMKLITLSQTENDEIMLYYDSNYLGDIYKIKPYSVPMFANHPYGTVTRDIKIHSKLPQNMQSLMYTINQSDNISEEMIAPFMSFMYNNINIERTLTGNNIQDVQQISIPPDKVNEYEKQYAKFHENYKQELDKAKQNFSLTNLQSKITLETALKKHIQYPTDKLRDSAKMLSPVYPVQVEFTIDGINGFKYGDALQFDALPERYKTNTTFSIISIVHSLNNSGDWTTKIVCVMRPKFN